MAELPLTIFRASTDIHEGKKMAQSAEDKKTERETRGKRNKRRGSNGERELAKLLRERLGEAVTRNLQQSRDGGADLDGTPFMLEVKRATEPSITTWWRQTVMQAVEKDGIPCLAYRIDRHSWQFVLPLGAIHPGFNQRDTGLTVTLGLEAFAAIAREKINANEN